MLGDGASATVPSGGSGFFAGFADKSVQIEGSFGTSGTLLIEGSNDLVNYETLTNPIGTPVSFTAIGLMAITEAVLWLRPRLSAQVGAVSLTVTMFTRKTQTP